MEEEFHESEVVFSEICQLPNTTSRNSDPRVSTTNTTLGINKSLPLDIPVNSSRYVDMIECKDVYVDDDDDEGYEDLERRRLPPHLIIARRINNLNKEMACSYCIEDGNGRILKGRNLFQVRNSILRLTGFIET